MKQPRTEILQGTLELMVLKALVALGPLHGYGIARRLEQVGEELFRLNEGTVYQGAASPTTEGMDHFGVGRL